MPQLIIRQRDPVLALVLGPLAAARGPKKVFKPKLTLKYILISFIINCGIREQQSLAATPVIHSAIHLPILSFFFILLLIRS